MVSRHSTGSYSWTKLAELSSSSVNNAFFYVHGQVHLTTSKQNAGLDVAEHTDSNMLSKLYPFTRTLYIPKDAAHVSIWSAKDQLPLPSPIVPSGISE